jgi:hypothetical protein
MKLTIERLDGHIHDSSYGLLNNQDMESILYECKNTIEAQQIKIKRLKEMLSLCNPNCIDVEDDCSKCGQGIGRLYCFFCGEYDQEHKEDCEYLKASESEVEK